MHWLALPAVLLIASCQSIAPAAPESVFDEAFVLMTPHFQCANFHSVMKNETGITEAIDSAASIGERFGLSPGQIMQGYRSVKQTQEGQVLELASEFADKREDGLPRVGGTTAFPTNSEEQRAWNSLYEEQC